MDITTVHSQSINSTTLDEINFLFQIGIFQPLLTQTESRRISRFQMMPSLLQIKMCRTSNHYPDKWQFIVKWTLWYREIQSDWSSAILPTFYIGLSLLAIDIHISVIYPRPTGMRIDVSAFYVYLDGSWNKSVNGFLGFWRRKQQNQDYM